MAIYKTLYAFKEEFGVSMGEPTTHPWMQSFPLTKQIPGGPEIPTKLEGINSMDLRYPDMLGNTKLREAICSYYRDNYKAQIDPDNIMIFAGGRPALFSIMFFLRNDIVTRIG